MSRRLDCVTAELVYAIAPSPATRATVQRWQLSRARVP